MKLSSKGIALIKKYESCRLTAYQCSAGVWTIGWGHTRNVKKGDTCTQAQADAWFLEDAIEFERYINNWFKNLNQNQFDALVSLCYNIGPGNLKKSPIFNTARLNPNDMQVRNCFMRHIYANGTHDGKDNDKDGLIDEPGEVQKLDGLIRRRTEEVALYSRPV